MRSSMWCLEASFLLVLGIWLGALMPTAVQAETPSGLTESATTASTQEGVLPETKDSKALSLVITAPNGGENWSPGTRREIRWTSSGVTGNIQVQPYLFGSPQTNIAAAAPNTGLLVWNVPANYACSAGYKMSISAMGGTVYDFSDGNFNIGRLTITAPNGGEVWTAGQKEDINWTSPSVSGPIQIQPYKGGVPQAPIDVFAPDDPPYQWTIPSDYPPGTNYTMSISAAAGEIWDFSDANFTILASAPAVDHIVISGASEVNEERGAQYTCTAYPVGGGNPEDVTNEVDWHVNSGYASINSSGYLRTLPVPADQSVQITAVLGNKTDTHNVTIVDVPDAPEVTGIQLSGPDPVDENSSTPYPFTCTAILEGAAPENVTTDALWGSSCGQASMDRNTGRLTTYEVDGNTLCWIWASYGDFTEYISTTITDGVSTPTALVISGDGEIPETQGAQYKCIASYADKDDEDVTNDSGLDWDETSSFASITSGGFLTAEEVTGDDHFEVTAEFRGENASYPVTIMDTTVEPPPAPNLIPPGENGTVHFGDVTFQWSAVSSVPPVSGYQFCIVRNDGEWSPPWEVLGPGTTTFEEYLQAYETYTWKVRAKNDADNWGPWSAPGTVYYTPPENLSCNLPNTGFSQEPVNTATGAYTYSHEDLSIPGRGLPFEFARFYNSRTAASTVMGNKWRHTYLVSLDEQPDESVVIHWANCTDDYYNSLGVGAYENAHFGFSGQLTKNPNDTFDFRTKALVTYHFDSGGKLQSITDRNTNALTLTYDGLARIDFVTDTVGRTIDLQYNPEGYLSSVVDPTGRDVTFTYEPDGDLETVTDMRGYPMTYSYDVDSNMTGIQDRRGNPMITNVYNADGQVTNQTNARLNTWDFNYTLEGVNTETDPLTGVTTHEYNEMSWLVRRTNANGNSEYYTYDEEGNRIEVTNARGYTTAYTYDTRGNVLTITDALDNTTTLTYNGYDQVTLIADPLGRETRFEFDVSGNLVRVIRPMDQVTSFQYDDLGQLIRAVDPLGYATEHGYDAEGNRLTTTNALGETTAFEYDAVGRLTRIIEPNTEDAVFTYDDEDNLETVTDQEDHQAAYTYDENGNRTNVNNPRGHDTGFTYNVNNLVETIVDAYLNDIVYGYDELDRIATLTDRRDKTSAFGYDAIGNRTSAEDPLGGITEFGYDAVGNRVVVKDANEHYAYYTYDALNRLTRVTDALGNTTQNAYDAAGRLVETTDPNGDITTYSYDDLNRLVRVEDALAGTASYTYDLNGNRTSITDPNGHISTYQYDPLNRLISETDALAKTTHYSYDSVGNLLTRADARGNITTYAYYPTHRLQTIDYPGASSVAFIYDENGNRTQMTDAAGTTAWQYDWLDRIGQVADPFGNAVGYGYDEASNRTAIEYDNTVPGSLRVDYTFDDNGRLETLTDWAAHTFTYHYDDAGNVTQLDYPNGCKEKRSYYPNGRLQTLTHEKPDETQFVAYTYYYDNAANIIGMDRKEAVEREFAAELTGYSYNDANEIRTAGDSHFTFDANGNQTGETEASGTTQYAYDFENRLTALNAPSADALSFTYNGVGDRIKTTEGATEKRYLLDLNKPLTDVLADTDAGNNVQQYYLYGLGLVGRVTPTNDLYQYHPDHLGSIMAVTNQSNAITAAFAYDEFGAVAGELGGEASAWRFCGAIGLQEERSGILLARERNLHYVIGGFTARDKAPLEFLHTQSLNRYTYVRNNPVLLVDPTGRTVEASMAYASGVTLGMPGDSSSLTDPIGIRLPPLFPKRQEVMLLPNYSKASIGVLGRISVGVDGNVSAGYAGSARPFGVSASVNDSLEVKVEGDVYIPTPLPGVVDMVVGREWNLSTGDIDPITGVRFLKSVTVKVPSEPYLVEQSYNFGSTPIVIIRALE